MNLLVDFSELRVKQVLTQAAIRAGRFGRLSRALGEYRDGGLRAGIAMPNDKSL